VLAFGLDISIGNDVQFQNDSFLPDTAVLRQLILS